MSITRMIPILPVGWFVRIGMVLASVAIFPANGSGQTVFATNLTDRDPQHVDSSLNAKGNVFIDRQDAALLKEVDSTLYRLPPVVKNAADNRERYLSLLLLDAVLHDRVAAYRKPVQDFFHRRVESVINELEHTRVEKGATIWKLYNMAFIVRTKTVTLAFDLTDAKNTGSSGFVIPASLMKRLIAQCDVLFISHRHQDHADEETAQRFIDAGKPVVTPPEIWRDRPIYAMITHLQRTADSAQTLSLGKRNGASVGSAASAEKLAARAVGAPAGAGGRTGSFSAERILKVVVYPGHQMGKIENNVPLVFTPEGISVCHMGDQINEGDFMVDYAWIDHVSEHYKVDILLPPCWTNEIFRIVEGFNPRLVIPGHENELGHPVDDRVPFWGDNDFLGLTYSDLKRSHYRVLPMVWGEAIHYTGK